MSHRREVKKIVWWRKKDTFHSRFQSRIGFEWLLVTVHCFDIRCVDKDAAGAVVAAFLQHNTCFCKAVYYKLLDFGRKMAWNALKRKENDTWHFDACCGITARRWWKRSWRAFGLGICWQTFKRKIQLILLLFIQTSVYCRGAPPLKIFIRSLLCIRESFGRFFAHITPSLNHSL